MRLANLSYYYQGKKWVSGFFFCFIVSNMVLFVRLFVVVVAALLLMVVVNSLIPALVHAKATPTLFVESSYIQENSYISMYLIIHITHLNIDVNLIE